MKFYNFQIIIEQEEDPQDGYFAYCPQLLNCYSNGATVEETRENMRDAIALHLAALQNSTTKELIFDRPRSLYKEELMIGLPS